MVRRLMSTPRYKADLGGGSLNLAESRVVANLLLEQTDHERWHHAIEIENVLQRRSPATARRLAILLRGRLRTMDSELWQMVRSGSTTVAFHAVFAATIKHSFLLGDFLDLVIRNQFRLFRTDLPRNLWAEYLEECRNRDPYMPTWLESTAAKQGDTAYRILAEIGYLADRKSYQLQPVRISADVLSYLHSSDERYVLRCIQVSQ
ncbi:BREX protein BrxA [Azospirillaceae bacterium]